MAFVVDASTILGWYFDEDSPSDELAKRITEENVVAPSHFLAELANGVVVGERRGRAKPEQIGLLHQLLWSIELELDSAGNLEALDRVLPLARAHRLTVYDALYLELAERRGLSLATRDGPLARAASDIGLEVLNG